MIILSFEGEYAVIQTESTIKKIPKILLPPCAKEGDIIYKYNNMYKVDIKETLKHKSQNNI